MTRKFYRIFAFFVLISSVMISCVPEEDLDPDADDVRDKFIGSWRFTETQVSRGIDGISYTVTISYDAGNSVQVLLKNFAQAGGQFSAYGIVTNNRITVPTQELSPGFTVSGSGTMTSLSSMDWEYTIIAGSDMESYTAIASK